MVWCYGETMFSVEVFDTIPAVSNRGVCFGTPTALTAAEKC